MLRIAEVGRCGAETPSDLPRLRCSLLASTATMPDNSVDPTLPSPVVRDVLRVCLSAKEYRFLHETALKRAPAARSKLPSPSRFDAIVRPKNRHSEAAARASLRVFLGSGIALKLGDLLLARFQGATEYDPHRPFHRATLTSDPTAERKHALRSCAPPNFASRYPCPSSFSSTVSCTASWSDCERTSAPRMRSLSESATRASHAR